MLDLADVRMFVYRWFAERGEPPRPEDIAAEFGVEVPVALEALRALHDGHLIVLDADRRGILMAHPWSAVSLGFIVTDDRVKWWGGCAWDSFALPHLLPHEGDVLVSTRCPACGSPHAWNVGTGRPPDGDQVAHFLVPVAHMWDDVVHTCRHQRLFCAEGCVDAWCRKTGSTRGYLMDLHTLWRLASHWYDGRLNRGYVRRDPQAATEYLRSVGLSGRFWGR
jgi:hypothetical protein